MGTYQDFLNPLSSSISQEELRQTGYTTVRQVMLHVYTDQFNKTIFNGKGEFPVYLLSDKDETSSQ